MDCPTIDARDFNAPKPLAILAPAYTTMNEKYYNTRDTFPVSAFCRRSISGVFIAVSMVKRFDYTKSIRSRQREEINGKKSLKPSRVAVGLPADTW
jgi:hypothetical protein